MLHVFSLVEFGLQTNLPVQKGSKITLWPCWRTRNILTKNDVRILFGDNKPRIICLYWKVKQPENWMENCFLFISHFADEKLGGKQNICATVTKNS